MQGVVLPVETLAEALRESRGMISIAARRCRMARQSLTRRIAASPTLQEVVRDERELLTDRAESVLADKILEGEAWAVCFYLKTQGKDRGYVERQETEQVGAVRVVVEYADADAETA